MQFVGADDALRSIARSCPLRLAGSSSGEMRVATTSSRVRRASPANSFSAAQRDQELHQRLGDADVGVVHAHVVAVVGAPAERQFGQVAGADHEAGVHQQAGAHAGLDVFEDQVVTFLRRHALQPLASVLPPHGDRCAGQVDAERVVPQGAHFFQAEPANVDLASRRRPGDASGRRRCCGSACWCRSRAW